MKKENADPENLKKRRAGPRPYSNTFPSSFKYAKVVPLLKSLQKLPLVCSSYRPVSLLPVLSRAVEKALFTQLSNYLENNNLLHPNHHGGRKYHNTTTALIQLNDEWLAAAEGRMMTYPHAGEGTLQGNSTE